MTHNLHFQIRINFTTILFGMIKPVVFVFIEQLYTSQGMRSYDLRNLIGTLSGADVLK